MFLPVNIIHGYSEIISLVFMGSDIESRDEENFLEANKDKLRDQFF